MNFANPTRLRLGMTGQFSGKDYRLVGRSVMGESEGGETYYWNEFNLATSSGQAATLVYEPTENGPQWRMFTLFDPEYPMTAADAATKQVGDRLNLTGHDVRVTFRGSSRVNYVEGEAPEGEEVGKVAEYFNAGSGSVMQVVSWTGDEVEFYNGVNLTSGLVALAFGLPVESDRAARRTFSSLTDSGADNYTSATKFALQAAFVIILFLVVFGRGFSCSRDSEGLPVAKVSAGAAPLTLNATGTVDGKNYHVTAHAVVAVSEVGSKWERHEYELTDDSGAEILLVCGAKRADTDWVFFEPFVALVPLTAKQAAAKPVGGLVELDGSSSTVSEIFLSTIEYTDGAGLTGLTNGAVSYGFLCASQYRPLLARWNDAGIQFFHGHAMTEKKAAASFSMAK